MKVLLLEDEPDLSAVAVEQLENKGYQVYTATGLQEARKILDEHRHEIDILIADHQVPDGSGAHFAIETKGALSQIQVIVVSGCLSLENVDELEAHGISYFNKPFLYADVVNALANPQA